MPHNHDEEAIESRERISSAQGEIVEKTNRLSKEFWHVLNATGEVPLYDGHQLTAQQHKMLKTEEMAVLAKVRIMASTSSIQQTSQSVASASRTHAAPATQQQPSSPQIQPIPSEAQQISTPIRRRK